MNEEKESLLMSQNDIISELRKLLKQESDVMSKLAILKEIAAIQKMY